MSEPAHNNEGNCWSPEAIYRCPECLDTCHEHDQPRGECDRCKRCATCDEEDLRTP